MIDIFPRRASQLGQALGLDQDRVTVSQFPMHTGLCRTVRNVHQWALKCLIIWLRRAAGMRLKILWEPWLITPFFQLLVCAMDVRKGRMQNLACRCSQRLRFVPAWCSSSASWSPCCSKPLA